MPTSNRRAFMSQAVRCFLNQDYPHLELLILDDGSDPIRDCLPEDPRVRYVHLDQKLILGAKRNLAVAQARGEIIAHWDDDDWYPRSRIRVQVQALLERGADLCGSSQLYFYEASSDRAWRYAYTDPTARWVAGSTMVYRKDFWARNRFPEIAIGEDTRFVWSQAAKTVADLADPSLCIASIHAGNSSPRVTRGHYWLPQPAEVVHALLDAEQARAVPPLPAPAVESAPQAWPLISCIMPTANRRPFVTLALDGFARQDYPNKELVIVDDGLDPVDDLTAGLADVRYVRLAVPASIGAKRNRACAEAQGEIIAHWDDDDWYAPSRLHYQAAPILAGDADITGLENSYLLALPDGQFWTTQPQLHRRMFVGDVHGGTLMYRKAILGGRVQYPAVNLAEDAMLLQQALRGGRRLLRLANDGVFVYVRHGSNAWQFETGRFLDPAGWQRIAAPVTFDAGLLARYQDALRDPAAASPRVPYQ